MKSASKHVIVAGGAGYVGSHTCLALARAGYIPVVYDNLSNGHRDFVQWGPFVEGDIQDTENLAEAFQMYAPVGVLHFAALIEVGESVKDPISFYRNNVTGAISLIECAKTYGVPLVFSSTCATYGTPAYLPVDEVHEQTPLNPYGRTKLVVEHALSDLRQYSNYPSIALRYFNAAGADPEGRIGEWHEPETHAIPIALDNALGIRSGFSINGDDYETRDGTCIRDYVHVLDLAEAHVKALERLLEGHLGGAFNLGTGNGTSVRELVETIKSVTGKSFDVQIAPRRMGDSPVLIANREKAETELEWRPRRNITEIITDAWNWHQKLRAKTHPDSLA